MNFGGFLRIPLQFVTILTGWKVSTNLPFRRECQPPIYDICGCRPTLGLGGCRLPLYVCRCCDQATRANGLGDALFHQIQKVDILYSRQDTS